MREKTRAHGSEAGAAATRIGEETRRQRVLSPTPLLFLETRCGLFSGPIDCLSKGMNIIIKPTSRSSRRSKDCSRDLQTPKTPFRLRHHRTIWPRG